MEDGLHALEEGAVNLVSHLQSIKDGCIPGWFRDFFSGHEREGNKRSYLMASLAIGGYVDLKAGSS